MDHVSFDRLTVRLATASTRRNRLGLALGAAGGGLASLFLRDVLEAEAKGKNGKKSKGKKGGKGKKGSKHGKR